ncbi:MAG: Gx transporter family protein, partial [Clostridia bacterium]|nr:Gx transporter family protein [Clostridia bacterium]
MNNKNHSAKRVALYGVLTALSLVFGYIEHLVPFPIGIYGIKLGLSNLVTVTVLYLV